MHQEHVFAHGEGDAWFARNQSHLAAEPDWATDPVLLAIDRAGLRPGAVLEVGAANGYRLAALCRRFGCTAVALEPSPQAIEDGQRRFPAIRFLRGESRDMAGLEDGAFDLVVVNFVLHWVDRRELLRSVAEIDRVLADEGHLVVGDFDPEQPQRVKYHHLPDADVWTYKQDYPSLWLASRLYEEVSSTRFHHSTRAVGDDVDPAHRGRVAVLRKTLHRLYRVGKLA